MLRPPARRRVRAAHRGHRRRAPPRGGRAGDPATRSRGSGSPGTRARTASRSGASSTAAPSTSCGSSGALYACDCSRDVVLERTKAHATPGYDGYCRDRGLERGPGRALRFRTPREGATVVHDVVRGEVRFQQRDDRGLRRRQVQRRPALRPRRRRRRPGHGDLPHHPGRGASPDDAEGHLALGGARDRRASAAGLRPPAGARERASARRSPSAATVSPSRTTAPRASCPRRWTTTWRCSAGARATAGSSSPGDELVAEFRLEEVNHSPAFFDEKKLLHFNGVYLRALPVDEFVARCCRLGGRRCARAGGGGLLVGRVRRARPARARTGVDARRGGRARRVPLRPRASPSRTPRSQRPW